MNFKTFLVLSLCICLSFAGYSPKHFWQNDARWSGTRFGFGYKTFAEDGSLVISIASIVAGLDIYLEYMNLCDPITMDWWLKRHGGYVQNDQIVWESLSPLGLEFTGFTINHEVMINAILKRNVVILEIKGENRYVVGFMVDADGFLCVDPSEGEFSGLLYYSIDDIAKAGIYKVNIL